MPKQAARAIFGIHLVLLDAFEHAARKHRKSWPLCRREVLQLSLGGKGHGTREDVTCADWLQDGADQSDGAAGD